MTKLDIDSNLRYHFGVCEILVCRRASRYKDSKIDLSTDDIFSLVVRGSYPPRSMGERLGMLMYDTFLQLKRSRETISVLYDKGDPNGPEHYSRIGRDGDYAIQ